MKPDDAPPGPVDFGLQLWVPPNVVGVDRDAEGGLADCVDDIVGLADGVHRAAAVRIHRVERFDREEDARVGGERGEFGQAFCDVAAGFGQGQIRVCPAD